MVDELADELERHAIGPVCAGQLVRPAHAAEPLLQVVEVRLGDLGRKGCSSVVSAVTLMLGISFVSLR